MFKILFLIIVIHFLLTSNYLLDVIIKILKSSNKFEMLAYFVITLRLSLIMLLCFEKLLMQFKKSAAEVQCINFWHFVKRFND